MTDQPDEHAPPDLDGVDQDLGPEGQEPEATSAAYEDDVLDEPGETRGATVATGHPAVDEVLRSLDGLDGRPVDEHVAAFEQAHEALRQALSNAGDDPVTRPEG